jgi:hypothetical protein
MDEMVAHNTALHKWQHVKDAQQKRQAKRRPTWWERVNAWRKKTDA